VTARPSEVSTAQWASSDLPTKQDTGAAIT
jgi:hypothetical protein